MGFPHGGFCLPKEGEKKEEEGGVEVSRGEKKETLSTSDALALYMLDTLKQNIKHNQVRALPVFLYCMYTTEDSQTATLTVTLTVLQDRTPSQRDNAVRPAPVGVPNMITGTRYQMKFKCGPGNIFTPTYSILRRQ